MTHSYTALRDMTNANQHRGRIFLARPLRGAVDFDCRVRAYPDRTATSGGHPRGRPRLRGDHPMTGPAQDTQWMAGRILRGRSAASSPRPGSWTIPGMWRAKPTALARK